MKLPSEPLWDDGLPRIRSWDLEDESIGDALKFAVTVPGGEVVAGFLTEALAREFVAWLGQQYASRAVTTMKALDAIAVNIGFGRNMRGMMPTRSGAAARRIFREMIPPKLRRH